MRTLRFVLVASLFSLPLAHVVGCSSNNTNMGDADPFDTFQDCFDDHHGTEGFSIPRAIEICCIDHPIGGAAANTVCGETEAACQTYVDANLNPADAMATDISTACSDYIKDRAG
jgi:hypothetical protein